MSKKPFTLNLQTVVTNLPNERGDDNIESLTLKGFASFEAVDEDSDERNIKIYINQDVLTDFYKAVTGLDAIAIAERNVVIETLDGSTYVMITIKRSGGVG